MKDPRPLAGVRVLDLTWVLGGPFAAMQLGDLGAEVIKIEPPEGDYSRTVPPHFFAGDSLFYVSINRNKLSLVLDLKTPDGLRVLHDLVKKSDIFMSAFSPEATRRMKIDYPRLRRVNPRLIVANLVAFDSKGPWRDKPGFDSIVQAMGGVMSLTGEPGGPPQRVGYHVGDQTAGLYLATAILAALIGRQRTGRGQRLEVSLLDCQVAYLTMLAQNYLHSGTVPGPTGNRNPLVPPVGAYRTSDGKWVMISVTREKFWQALCRALGHPAWITDSRFATAQARLTHAQALYLLCEDAFGKFTQAEVLARLDGEEVPAGPVQRVDEVLSHPLTRSREMLVSVKHPRGGELRLLGSPMKFSAAPRGRFTAPPALGQDTEKILSGLLDYSPRRIKALWETGVTRPAPTRG
ncbi:MAG: L-carnitine dehydratase/bile acid-inducible protein F [Candidatus Rokubacteria bacterium CSP1-6]|nr:MAG: L-carnitine dehydratase/bile acid-inducible protein F [Candidatus Rokubacteria bacterium CSP1-6]